MVVFYSAVILQGNYLEIKGFYSFLLLRAIHVCNTSQPGM